MKDCCRVSYLLVLGALTLQLAPGAWGQTIVLEPGKDDGAADASSEVLTPTPEVESETVEGGISDAAPAVVSSSPDVESAQAEEKIADESTDGTPETADESTKATSRQDGKFLFLLANKSTTTKFLLSVFSSTTPYTCAITRSTALCAGSGRRKRFFKGNNIDKLWPTELTSIDSSLDTPLSKRSGRNGFVTVWTTSYSTRTVTSYYSNTRVTVSVSQACTIPGVNFPQCG